MNMKSKYLVLATTFLLAFSSSASVATAATHGLLFPPTAVDTHGPRLATIDFYVIASDPSLAGSLVTGTIQAPEWTFTAGSYDSLAASKNVLTGKTEGYTFEGIVFNGIQPIISAYDFRQAIQLLTVYTGGTSLDTTILTGDLAGVATADLMPCNLYVIAPNSETDTSTHCKSAQVSDDISPDQVHPEGWVSNQILDDQKAAELLADITYAVCNAGGGVNDSACSTAGYASGLYAQLNGVNVTEATIASWTTAQATTNLPSLQWYVNTNATLDNTSPGASKTAFYPNLQYRSDDPLRSGAAVLLVSIASDIGLAINAQGITDSEADTIVYGNAVAPIVSNAGYCAAGAANYTAGPSGNAGTNNCPSVEITNSQSIQSTDYWDMYTYGWVASSNYEFQAGEWMNSQYLEDEITTGSIVSQQCDIAENNVLYGGTYAAAQTAAFASETCSVQNLQSMVLFYESYLFGNYINGWTGYASLPSCGANTVTCSYYTFLNAHPTQSGVGGTTYNTVGGTMSYAVHGPASYDGLSTWSYPNWVWQNDIWSEIVEAPLGTPTTALTVPGAWSPWMLSGKTEPTTAYGSTSSATLDYGTAPFGGSAGGVQVATFSSLTISGGSLTLGGQAITGAYCFQVPDQGPYNNETLAETGASCNVTIPNGEAITYTFDTNMTWSDGVPITAADYNYSAVALNVVGNTAGAPFSPYIGEDAGPFGLIADSINTTANSITMYFGDQAVWNIIAADWPILPAHIYENFNLGTAFTFEASAATAESFSALDTTNSSFFQNVLSAGYTCSSAPTDADACPLTALLNLEVASGPYELLSFNPATGAGVMIANLNYYRTAWYDALSSNEVKATSGTITFTATPSLLLASNTMGPTAVLGAGATVSSCTATLQGYTGTIPAPTTNIFVGVKYGSSINANADVTGCGTSNTDTITIPTSSLVSGKVYKVTFEEQYTFDGIARIWYQYYGFVVTGSVASVTGTPTS